MVDANQGINRCQVFSLRLIDPNESGSFRSSVLKKKRVKDKQINQSDNFVNIYVTEKCGKCVLAALS